MTTLKYLKLNNKLHILIALFLPLLTMMSHSVGHDEWSYFLELHQSNPNGFIDPTYTIALNLNELASLPRYLLGFFYLDFLKTFTSIPIFLVFIILFAVPNIILFKYILTARKSLYLIVLLTVIAYFNSFTNFYHLGFLYILASLHSKNLLRYCFFFLGVSLHPVSFVVGGLVAFLSICRRWKFSYFIPIPLLFLAIFFSDFYAKSYIEKVNIIKTEDAIKNLNHSNKIEIVDIIKTEDAIKNLNHSNKIGEKIPINEIEIIKTPEEIETIKKNNLGFEVENKVPLFFRMGFSYERIFNTGLKRVKWVLLVILCFIFFRKKNHFSMPRSILFFPSIIIISYLALIGILGQSIHGGPAIFLGKNLLSFSSKPEEGSYIMPPNDALMMKSLFGKEIEEFYFADNNCNLEGKLLVSFLPPFLPVLEKNSKFFKSKIDSNCLPEDLKKNNFQNYALLYDNSTDIGYCVREILTKYPEIGLKRKHVEGHFKLFYFHFFDTPNAKYSNLNQFNLEIVNCAVEN
jgi:hypothetical protein